MINSFFIFISIFWSIVFAKKLLFWVYLWQLKEYHIGRFRDHFRTYKGKVLVLNWWLLLKVLILFGIYFLAELIFRHVKDMEDFTEDLENKFSILQKSLYYVIDEIERECFMDADRMVELKMK